MAILELSKFSRSEKFPTAPFLQGQNILDQSTFNSICKFDFSKCKFAPKSVYDARRMIQFKPGNFSYEDEASQALQDLINYANDFDLFVEFAKKAGEGVAQTVHTRDIDKLRKRYFGSILSVVIDDEKYVMPMHVDASPGLQIYLDPPGAGGTRFHFTKENWSWWELPFEPNAGYFQINVPGYYHSVVNTVPNRKSVIIFWMMLDSFHVLLPKNALLQKDIAVTSLDEFRK